MPQPNNALRHQQWQSCDQCGRLFPMSQLTKQKGALICNTRTCWDNLQVERRPWVINEILGPTPDQEGADLRVIDRGFFEGYDDVQA